MKVKMGGKIITLSDRDVKTAKKAVSHFLDTYRNAAEEQNAKTFIYTLLIVMNIMSTDYINTLSPEFLALILDAAAQTEEERKLVLKMTNKK